MSELRLFSLHPPYREKGTVVRPLPEYRATHGFANVPGYFDKMDEVRMGLRDPFWGTEYTLNGSGTPPDVVDAYASQYGVSERLKCLLIDAGVQGLRFHPIVVDGRTTMYLLGVGGVVGIHPAPMELRLLDGAEVGLYEKANLYVNCRIAGLMRKAELDLDLDEAVITPD